MKNTAKVNYYDSFHCLADQCPYTCCQEWGISVDDETRQKWQTIKMETLGLRDEENPELTLCSCLEKEGEGYIISLKEDKTCPFLDGKKLCQLVVELGMEYSANICRQYPRYTNEFKNRDEYSLDFGCPAVIDLINNQPKGVEFIEEGAVERPLSLLEEVRAMIIQIIQNEEYSLTEGMMMSFYCLMELLEAKDFSEETVEEYLDKEYLDGLVNELRQLDFDPIDSFWERNELFQDIIQLYRREGLYGEYIEEIALWAERLSEWYSDEAVNEKNKSFEKQYIPFEKLLRNYLAAEIWASCLKEESELEDIVMVCQWIMLEYCAIRQAIFLKWLIEEEKEIGYEDVREYLMIISRMAGYDQSDIKNWLECSFDTKILEWGYIALVLGNGRI
ncbi:MAG: flagellin lysine-N-methylase [Cellulosilyticaceae bacterium]